MRRLPILLLLCLFGVSQADNGLRELDGTPASLEHYRGDGRWLVVKVWASTCHVCQTSVREMIELHDERGRGDLRVIGIAVDGFTNRPGVLRFIERHGVNFPTLLDDGTNTARLYAEGVGEPWGGWTPTYLVYAPGGELVAKNIGAVDKQNVVRFIDGFSPPVHLEDS